MKSLHLLLCGLFLVGFRLVNKGTGRKGARAFPIGPLLQGTGLGWGPNQSGEKIGYLPSGGGLSHLSRKADPRRSFRSSKADFFSRFPTIFQDDTFEGLYEYYGSMVSAQSDSATGLTVLNVSAFTAGEAQSLNAGLLDLSE